MLCFKMSLKCLYSCQTIVRQKSRIFPYYCKGNKLKNACEKFEFLSNNCLAKKRISPSYCTGNMLQYACGKFEFLSCFKMPVKCLYSFQTIFRQKRRIFPSYCTGNMLQKSCGKFEFLSNNCLAKKRISPSYCTGNMLQYACEKFEFGSNKLFGRKQVFRLAIVQAISLKMPVKSSNYCQTIVRRKRRISPCYCEGNLLQNACEKYKFLSNNCLAKKRISPSYCAGNLLQNACEKFKQLFDNKGVFLRAVVQATCFKMPVKILSSCQTIVWQSVFLHAIIQEISS
jgi:hypothetical protein